MIYFTIEGINFPTKYFELNNGKLIKQFIGGDRLATFELSAPIAEAAALLNYFNIWLGKNIKFNEDLWHGFIAELEINYGSFRYRRSLLDQYASRVKVEYDPGSGTPLFTSTYVNGFAEESFYRKDFVRTAHYLTSSDAATFAQRLLDEMSHPNGKFIGMSSEQGIVVLNVTCIGHFFRVDWREFEPYGPGLASYPVDADVAVTSVLTNQLPDIPIFIEDNNEQIVGPPNETDPYDYLKEISTHTNSFNYYRIWYNPRVRGIVAEFIDYTDAIAVSDGQFEFGKMIYNLQPGFFRDISIPAYFGSYSRPDVQNIIFAETLTLNIKEDGTFDISIGDANNLGVEDLYDLHIALELQTFIENRDEANRLAEEARRIKEQEQENES